MNADGEMAGVHLSNQLRSMIPIRDKNPTRLFPIVNISIIAVNIIVFAYEVMLGDRIGIFSHKYALVPSEVTSVFSAHGIHVLPLAPLLTSMFVHGGWLHLGGNMLYLWIFGDNVEDKLGHARYAVFYVMCGVAASVLHIVIDPRSAMPTVGASGAISGILGAYLLMFPRARVVTLIPIFIFLQVAELPALFVIGFWFVLQFFNGLVSLGYKTAGMGGVAWWAHIGGFVSGLLLVVPFRRYR